MRATALRAFYPAGEKRQARHHGLGGIQEETTYLGVPCLTLRDSTERPVTVAEGTNILVKPGGADFSGRLQKELKKIFAGKSKKGRVPEKWDGRAAERTVRVLKTELA